MDKEAKDLLADVIDGLAATEKQVGDLAAALLALRLTFAEMGPDFEKRYLRHFVGPEVQEVIRRNAASRDLLLQIAQRLRDRFSN